MTEIDPRWRKPLGLKPPEARARWRRPREPYKGPEGPSSAAVYGESGTVHFKGRPVRHLPIDGVPWFVLEDLREAAGFDLKALNTVNSPDFPAFAKVMATEAPDPEVPGQPADVLVLSPVGVWYWSHLFDPGRGQAIAAWAKRETAALHPNPAKGDPHVFLALLDDGDLPPYPLKHSGRKSEWIELSEDRAFIIAAAQRLSPPPAPIAN